MTVATLRAMGEPVFELKKQIKTTAIADAALGQIVMRLRASPRVRWKGGRATQEAVYNAVWLWLEQIDPGVIEEAMTVFVPRLEALMRGEDPDAAAADEPPATVPGPGPPQIRPGDPIPYTIERPKRKGRKGAG